MVYLRQLDENLRTVLILGNRREVILLLVESEFSYHQSLFQRSLEYELLLVKKNDLQACNEVYLFKALYNYFFVDDGSIQYIFFSRNSL